MGKLIAIGDNCRVNSGLVKSISYGGFQTIIVVYLDNTSLTVSLANDVEAKDAYETALTHWSDALDDLNDRV